MANQATGAIASAGQTTSRAVGDTLGKAGDLVSTAAARAREGGEDLWADARNEADTTSGRDAAVAVGLTASTVLGVVEFPVAAALGAGYVIFRRVRG